MRADVYRYEFDSEVPMEEVEASILLALLATESLHGECNVQLIAPHFLDVDRRACVVDASTPVGRDFNHLLLGFLRHEFGATSFRLQTVDSPQPRAAA
jgi:hypothetical protein